MENTVRRAPRGGLRCAFTGYRPQKLPFGFDESDDRCEELKKRLRQEIGQLISEGYTYFLSGGALGVDMYAAEIVLEFRKMRPEIYLEMVLPFEGQSKRWEPQYRLRHARMFECADKVTLTGKHYSCECMSRRNRYLVDNCDMLLACYDGKSGGTAMTVEYAMRSGVDVRFISPDGSENGYAASDICAI